MHTDTDFLPSLHTWIKKREATGSGQIIYLNTNRELTTFQTIKIKFLLMC